MNLSKQTKAPKTTQRRATTCKLIGKFIGIKDVLEDYRIPTAPRPKPHPLPGLLDDLQSLLAHCRYPAQRFLIAALGFEGLRLHEALALKTSDLDLGKQTITVIGKGYHQRTIPITKRAWDIMSTHVLAVMTGGREQLLTYSDRGARYFITSLGEKAGIKRPISSHDLRATFATLAYAESKNNIRLVQEWLGHNLVETTQTYIDVTIADMRAGGEF